MKIILFYNSKSGTFQNSPGLAGSVSEKIRSSLQENDNLSVYDVQENNADDILNRSELNENDKVIIAGGDGTISSVLNKIISFKKTVGIIPTGTFNNFSKTLNISENIDEAVKNIFKGKIKNIDVGKVNGRIMINNSSVGIYPKMVFTREKNRVKFGLGKPTAMFISFIKTFFLFPLIKVSVESENVKDESKTSFMMVSNNRYKLNLFEIGERKTLTEGKIYLYFIKCRTRLCVVKTGLKALFNKLDQEKDFDLIPSESAEFIIKKEKVDVALDGEVYKMKPPLKYEICPGCLKIIVPEK